MTASRSTTDECGARASLRPIAGSGCLFSLRLLILRPTMDALRADVGAPVASADPPNMGSFARQAPTDYRTGVTPPTSMLEAGTAPGSALGAGELGRSPFNPTTNKPYREAAYWVSRCRGSIVKSLLRGND